MTAVGKAEPRWDGVVRNDYDWRGFRTDLADDAVNDLDEWEKLRAEVAG